MPVWVCSHITEERAKRVESFQQLLAVKFFSKRKCGPEMGRGLPEFSQLVKSQAGPGIQTSQLTWAQGQCEKTYCHIKMSVAEPRRVLGGH